MSNSLWPKIRRKIKRAITFDEHQALKNHIENKEWKDFLETLWWTGGAETIVSCVRSTSRIKKASTGLRQGLMLAGNNYDLWNFPKKVVVTHGRFIGAHVGIGSRSKRKRADFAGWFMVVLARP
jgi:hypothetical protein